jgi:lipid-A-disaccharide synthase
VPDVLIVAAEASADLHGAGFVRALRARRPDVRVIGVGGARLAAEGVEILARSESFAVMGFTETFAHVAKHAELFFELRARLRSGAISLLVLLDYPEFNMMLAGAAKSAGVPVLYYITPQAWAWREGRLRRLGEHVTRAACILPFEEPLLRKHGVNATFVGHPLLDRITRLPSREEARADIGVPADATLLAIFPGSRAHEVERHLDAAVGAARILETQTPGLRVVLAVAPTIDMKESDVPYPLVRGASLTVLRAADAALCKSGTTTLEAAVAGCPLVVVYKLSTVSYAIAKMLVRVETIGLVNLIAGKKIAPELVQDDFTADAAAKALAPLLDHASNERRMMVEELAKVRAALGTPGAAERVAGIADEMLGAR